MLRILEQPAQIEDSKRIAGASVARLLVPDERRAASAKLTRTGIGLPLQISGGIPLARFCGPTAFRHSLSADGKTAAAAAGRSWSHSNFPTITGICFARQLRQKAAPKKQPRLNGKPATGARDPRIQHAEV